MSIYLGTYLKSRRWWQNLSSFMLVFCCSHIYLFTFLRWYPIRLDIWKSPKSSRYTSLWSIESTKIYFTHTSSCLRCLIRNYLLCLQSQKDIPKYFVQICEKPMGSCRISFINAKIGRMDSRRKYSGIFHRSEYFYVNSPWFVWLR